MLAGRPNVWVDTSSSLYALEPEEAARIIRRYGTDRAFFGTDYPMWDPEEEMARFPASAADGRGAGADFPSELRGVPAGPGVRFSHPVRAGIHASYSRLS